MQYRHYNYKPAGAEHWLLSFVVTCRPSGMYMQTTLLANILLKTNVLILPLLVDLAVDLEPDVALVLDLVGAAPLLVVFFLS